MVDNKKKDTAQTNSPELLLSSREYFVQMVESGFCYRKIKTIPSVAAYLVELLEFYLDARNLYDEPRNEFGQRNPTTLAEMYLVAANSVHSEKINLLKKMADRTLYISGFFGDSLHKKTVDVEYYVNMGGVAYRSLSECVRQDTVAHLYATISKRFVDFVEVLSYVSDQSLTHNDRSLLQLYERYIRTGSEAARQKLVEMGVMTTNSDQVRSAKQN